MILISRNMSGYQIECISLSKQFTGNKKVINAVDNVDLQIRQNEIVILKGRSGAGKSTLLNLMCGLINPTSGKIIIESTSINELPNRELSRLLSTRIGIIFQSFNLLPTYTVYENIEIALVPTELRHKQVRENINFLLEQFDLKDKSQLLPSELSVGQQQKVAIIRTLIRQPSVIFADEPTGSVDDETAREILGYLINLRNEKNVTLVLATHGNIPDKTADRVILMENGSIRY
jgi:putative ABC transport system ATP-binding protein